MTTIDCGGLIDQVSRQPGTTPALNRIGRGAESRWLRCSPYQSTSHDVRGPIVLSSSPPSIHLHASSSREDSWCCLRWRFAVSPSLHPYVYFYLIFPRVGRTPPRLISGRLGLPRHRLAAVFPLLLPTLCQEGIAGRPCSLLPEKATHRLALLYNLSRPFVRGSKPSQVRAVVDYISLQADWHLKPNTELGIF